MATDIIQQNLAASNVTFLAKFGELFSGVLPGEYSKYSDSLKVDTLVTEFDVITNHPKMRKWVGARREQKMRAYSQRVTLEPWEVTIPVSRRDLQFSDKLGLVAKSIKDALNQEVTAYDDAVHTGYVSNSGAGPTGYDNVSLFNASHPHGYLGATQGNLGALALTPANLDAVMTIMMSYRMENGNNYRVRPTHLRVGPKNANNAKTILTTTQRLIAVNNTGAEAASAVVAAAGISNVYQGQLELIIDPNLIGTMDDWWEVLDLSKPGLRPVIHVIGRPPTAIHQDKMDSDRRFQHDEFLYGLEGDWTVAAGLWQLAYRNVL